MNCVHKDKDGFCLKYSTYVADVYCKQPENCEGFAAWDEDGKYFCVLTNADRIRAMSDEELAVWLCDICSICDCCAVAEECREVPGYEVCRGNVAEWLRQPVKDGDSA
jgi:hypothetical protein